jgi:diaminohydroxyphosphoribosylaminopyrimidine deaminase/5-amino-6-(5-phosphoribosylamino)uracil reductase
VVDPDGRQVGEGAHEAPGQPHAEVVALEAAGAGASGATLYVTLEPCSHLGLTPPCVDAITAAGVARVVMGVTDPDSRVSGTGAARLREAGVEVVEGVMGDEVVAMDPAYHHHRKTGMPLVTLKYAMTLDGSVAAHDGTSKWITGEEARMDAHGLRAEADAVVIGAGTLRSDDPGLDVRLSSYEGPQPRPVIVAGREPLPADRRIWQRRPLVLSVESHPIPAGSLIEVTGEEGRPDPVVACRALADLGLLSILVEGGPTIASSWWAAGVVDLGVVYVGAKLGGGGGRTPMSGVFESVGDAQVVSITGVRSLEGDVRIDFRRS